MVYEYEIGTHAGCLPHRLEVLSGQLPPGTRLRWVGSPPPDSTTHVLEGVLTQSGTFSAWLAVRDCDNRSAETLFTFEIGPRTYAITTTSLPPATVGAAYSAKLQAGGHPVRSEEWKVTAGALPAGLTLAPDGTISGTPSAPGSSTFTVTATSIGDDGAARVDSRQFAILVGGKIAVTASRRAAEVGIRFRSTLSVSGGQGPYRWSATGTPPGLTVGADGVISGVPTRAGSYTLTARFVDASGAAEDASVAHVVYPRLAIATKRLPAAVSGRPYRAKIAFRGGAPGFRWTVARGKLPRGLTLAAGTGTITGRPAGKGTARVTVRVRDSLGAVAQKALVLAVR